MLATAVADRCCVGGTALPGPMFSLITTPSTQVAMAGVVTLLGEDRENFRARLLTGISIKAGDN